MNAGDGVVYLLISFAVLTLCFFAGRAYGADEALQKIQKQADRDAQRQRILRRIKSAE